MIFVQAPTFPAWMNSQRPDEITFPARPYRNSIYRIPRLGRDMNGVAVGHAMAYEALITGRKPVIETAVRIGIERVLARPPRMMPDERTLSPTFGRSYPALEKVFDWAHRLHAETLDLLSYPYWTDQQKDAEIERLWTEYSTLTPYSITGLPMNMDQVWNETWSRSFMKTYPRVNGLFWGYHWLQSAAYDMLYKTPIKTQIPQYDVIGDQYFKVELRKIDRSFMPMMGEISPRFAKRFPKIANAFDNLHMLHDLVNDILAVPDWSQSRRELEVQKAIVVFLDSSHQNEVPGAHDHRHPNGMPGMGLMNSATPEAMYMDGMGWMAMDECSHCSIALGALATTVTLGSNTMAVRCLLCARDMASETPGRAIIRSTTEDSRAFVMISDDEGNWKSSLDSVVFLEKIGEHEECASWSRAFSSVKAFDAYVAENPEYVGAKPLTLGEWGAKSGGKPATYKRISRPKPGGDR